VLGPHHGKDAELNQVRLTTQERLDVFEFVESEIVRGDYFGSDLFHNQ